LIALASKFDVPITAMAIRLCEISDKFSDTWTSLPIKESVDYPPKNTTIQVSQS
jgi:hypothetical protein